MGTKLARITILMPPDMHKTLLDAKQVTGQSMTGLIVELLGMGLPVVERMTAVFRSIKVSTEAERAKFRQSCDLAMDELDPLVRQSFEVFDKFLVQQAGSEESTAGQPADAPASPVGQAGDVSAPPSTNRGGTNTASCTDSLCKGVSSDAL